MSSSTGPYKSRFLNFLNRQVLHVGDRLERSVRQMKVAAEWGAQVLLYPVYLLVQSGRMAGHQLHRSVEHKRLTSQAKPQQPSVADKPIKQVLAAIGSPKNQEIREKIRPDNLQPNIQGIASLLEPRRLVLVRTDNQILDILTPDWQQKLRQRITWEVADYWYHRRLVQATKTAGRLPSYSQNRRVLAPIRWFWRTMSWVQASPVALSFNLFGELSFGRFVASRQHSVLRAPLPTGRLANSDPQPVALAQAAEPQKWFSLARINFPAKVKPDRISSLIKAAVDYFFGNREQALSGDRQAANAISSLEATTQLPAPSTAEAKQPLATPKRRRFLVGNWFNAATRLVPATKLTHSAGDRLKKLEQKLQSHFSNLEASEPNPFQLGVLIRAAIDYYFSKPKHSLFSASDGTGTISARLNRTEASHSAFASSQLPTQPATENWLSWEDLFAPASVDKESNDKQPNSRPNKLQEAPSTPANLGRSPLEIIKRRLHRHSQPTDSAKVSSSSTKEASKQAEPASKSHASTATSISKSRSQNDSLESAPDWIEADATAIGYVKHPLEKILGWLDRAMLWLEELVTSIWSWLSKFTQSRS